MAGSEQMAEMLLLGITYAGSCASAEFSTPVRWSCTGWAQASQGAADPSAVAALVTTAAGKALQHVWEPQHVGSGLWRKMMSCCMVGTRPYSRSTTITWHMTAATLSGSSKMHTAAVTLWSGSLDDNAGYASD